MPHIYAGVTSGKPEKPASLPVRAKRWIKGTPWRFQAEMYPLNGKPLPFSHVYLRWHDVGRCGAVYNLVCHSTGKHGVDLEPIEQAFATRDVYAEFQIEVTDEQFCKLVAWSLKRNGTEYGNRQLTGIGLARFLEYLARKVLGWELEFKRNPLGGDGDVCSETGVTGLRDNVPDLFGEYSFKGKHSSLVAPADFYEELCLKEKQFPERVKSSTRKT